MRVADYVAQFVASKGVKKVFMIVGGMSMHLNDALGNHPALEYVCSHHEQATVCAADAYARKTGVLGVACVTAGPGATNTLTGVVTAHFDSSPLMVISGQTKAREIKHEGVRQFGIQGFETLPIFESVTKYAACVDKPEDIRYHMERAFYEATSGRPGAVWIEIPLDVQGKPVDPQTLKGFEPPTQSAGWEAELEAKMPKLLDALRKSKRPLFMLGNGLKASKSAERAIAIARALRIPVITSRLGTDCIGSDDELFVGRPGTYGTRPAAFAVQNCDFYLGMGCRHSPALVGYTRGEYAKNAFKVIVDIDAGELGKPSFGIDLPIRCDLARFTRELEQSAARLADWEPRERWLAKCGEWKSRYPVVLPQYERSEEGINSYYFTKALSQKMDAADTIVLDTSSPFHVVSQAVEIKRGQTFITTGGLSGMGYGLPAAVGAAAAGGRVCCISGDGSLQMNIHELQTIIHYRMPVKIFVINNDGYLLIRHTQRNHMGSRFVGEGPQTGVSCPSLEKVAGAYGYYYQKAQTSQELPDKISAVLAHDGPAILEVISPPWQKVWPRVASEKKPDGTMVSRPFDDMEPFLDPQEYRRESEYHLNDG